ncbi:MAG: ATP synthase F1 subunit delta [Flavobacteriaceae bacterium]|nr:ATP synthase F1 subunit delta [Flavobacteriaceae bacterium]|tara:strand:- start:10687 stop:11238 length:552 start_codon:yes stop_codon:yes gene_type:complete
MMVTNRAANRYAKASLEYAQENKTSPIVEKDFKKILYYLSTLQDLEKVLLNPILPSNVKHEIILEVITPLHMDTKSILLLLANNKRLSILPNVAHVYLKLFQEAQGIAYAKVTTAVPLEESLENKILDTSKLITNSKVYLEKKIDSSIIGGFILDIGDYQLNGSVANQLKRLKSRLNQNQSNT